MPDVIVGVGAHACIIYDLCELAEVVVGALTRCGAIAIGEAGDTLTELRRDIYYEMSMWLRFCRPQFYHDAAPGKFVAILVNSSHTATAGDDI